MLKVLLALICAIFLVGCYTDEKTSVESAPAFTLPEIPAEPVYRKISASEAREMMETTAGFILLDVRTDEEFEEIRLNGAVLIPDYEILERAEAELPDKNALILIYCRRGRRSEIAARELAEMGYTNVYDFGGINDWPYETVSG